MIGKYYEKLKSYLQSDEFRAWLRSNGRELAGRIWQLVRNHPLLSLLIASVLALLIFAWASGWEREIDNTEHFNRQTELRNRAAEKVSEGAAAEARAEALIEQADAARSRYEAKKKAIEKQEKQIKEKKKNAQKAKEKLADSGSRDIADSDVSSNFELCTRANRLGVRCDFDR